VNQAITITGAGANNGVYHVATISGTTLTLAERVRSRTRRRLPTSSAT